MTLKIGALTELGRTKKLLPCNLGLLRRGGLPVGYIGGLYTEVLCMEGHGGDYPQEDYPVDFIGFL